MEDLKKERKLSAVVEVRNKLFKETVKQMKEVSKSRSGFSQKHPSSIPKSFRSLRRI